MFKNKQNYSLLLLGITLVIGCAVAQENINRGTPCPIAYKCSDIEDPVWATDGSTCFVYRNECQLKNENCQRQNRYDNVLKVVPKEECQLLCRPFCTADYRPVCASYNNVERTFSNPCALSSHVCLSGETFSLYRQGECNAPGTATQTTDV